MRSAGAASTAGHLYLARGGTCKRGNKTSCAPLLGGRGQTFDGNLSRNTESHSNVHLHDLL